MKIRRQIADLKLVYSQALVDVPPTGCQKSDVIDPLPKSARRALNRWQTYPLQRLRVSLLISRSHNYGGVDGAGWLFRRKLDQLRLMRKRPAATKSGSLTIGQVVGESDATK